MKYKWTTTPPKGQPGVGTERANVWPKPIKESLKYTEHEGFSIAIGQLKNGRWEVYFLGRVIDGPVLWKWKWLAKSRMCKLKYRVGYAHYPNAYRSILQHLKTAKGL